MVQDVGIGDAEFAADSPESQVPRSEDEARYARGDQGSGTHHAGFQSAVEGGGFQAVVSDPGCGLPQGQDFGVRRRIAAGNRGIAAAAGDFVFDDDNCADRDFAFPFALPGKTQGFAEVVLVSAGNASPP